MKNSLSYNFLVFVLLLSLYFMSCKGKETNGESLQKSETNAVNNEDRVNAVTSLTGELLYPIKESAESIAKKDSALLAAKALYVESATEENAVWYGRRMAYRGYYHPAIQHYTQAIQKFPESAALYRHRGHRYISTRQFHLAIADFKKAAALIKNDPVIIEPDGIPNKLNIPLSNLQFNIYYHLGLAHYLKGEYPQAEEAYLECMKFSDNPDLIVATSDWLYSTQLRLGKNEEAKETLSLVNENMEMIENDSYFKRIMMYKGVTEPNSLLDLNSQELDKLNVVTQGYGVANHYMSQGDNNTFVEVLEKIIDTKYWAAFGYIAAEADLKRVREGTFDYIVEN